MILGVVTSVHEPIITNQNDRIADSDEDELSLYELFRLLWAGKWFIGAATAMAAITSVVFALMQPDVFRAQALLAPNEQDGSRGLSALAAQYSGLASLAGISIGGSTISDVSLGLEILQSRKFISSFIQKHDLLVPLMAAKGWDQDSGSLLINRDLYDVTTSNWVRKVRPPRNPIPSDQEAYSAFRKILSVRQDRKTKFVTIGIEHYSPVIARDWVIWLVDDLNETIMTRDLEEAERSIAYLHQQIEKTSVATLQELFYKLIEEKTKTMLLANVSEQYFLKTIDPPIAPEERAKPNRRLIAVLGTFLGGLLGLFGFVLVHKFAGRNTGPAPIGQSKIGKEDK